MPLAFCAFLYTYEFILKHYEENRIYMTDIMLINVTEGAPAGGFASDGSSDYSYLNSVLPAYLKNDFHYTFCAEPVYYMQLAACLRKNGMSVEIVDGILMNLRLHEIKEIIDNTTCRIFGLTMFQANYLAVMDIIIYIKKKYPNSVVFSGGTYSSIVYDKLLLRHDEIDYVVVGDGDETVPALCKSIIEGKAENNIPGLSYKKNGKVYLVAPQPIDMDTVPYLSRDFAKEILDYKFSFSMVTSRGCGHGVCAFCYLPMYQKNSNHPKFRYRKPEDVVGEMTALRDMYGVDRITFVDEDYFGVHKIGIPRAEAIADLLIKQRTGIIYYVNARINSLVEVIDKGLLPKLAESGLRYVFVGIESGSDSVLKKYKKGTSVEKIHGVVDELNKYGIKINPGLITFDPELSVGQVIDNVKMLEYIGYYDVFMFTRKLILLPGIKVGSVNQGWELPEFNTDVKNQEEYYKDMKTALLYDIMVWFRDTIFPYYKRIDELIEITSELRNELIQNHFQAFYSIANKVQNGKVSNLKAAMPEMQYYVDFVKGKANESN